MSEKVSEHVSETERKKRAKKSGDHTERDCACRGGRPGARVRRGVAPVAAWSRATLISLSAEALPGRYMALRGWLHRSRYYSTTETFEKYTVRRSPREHGSSLGR